MIEELYDSILSITNQIGYIDKELETNSKSLLCWSTNVNFGFNKWSFYNPPPYTVITFSHDNFFRAPYSCIIKEDGTYENIYI